MFFSKYICTYKTNTRLRRNRKTTNREDIIILIKCHGSDGKTYDRRPTNQELNPRYTIKTIKLGGGNIIVWGAFSWSGVGTIVQISERMNQHVYKRIPQDVKLPFFFDEIPLTCVF